MTLLTSLGLNWMKLFVVDVLLRGSCLFVLFRSPIKLPIRSIQNFIYGYSYYTKEGVMPKKSHTYFQFPVTAPQ